MRAIATLLLMMAGLTAGAGAMNTGATVGRMGAGRSGAGNGAGLKAAAGRLMETGGRAAGWANARNVSGATGMCRTPRDFISSKWRIVASSN